MADNKMAINKEYQFVVGQKVYYKSKSNIHPLATYVGKVVDIYPNFIRVEGCPMEETMEEKFVMGEPTKYKYCISFVSIGNDDVQVWVDKAA